MLFLRLLGVIMADDAPENAGQAVRNYLGGLGFIVTLIGAELIKESHLYIGIFLVVAGLPIFLSGVLWKWLRTKLGNRASAWLGVIASDPRWWLVSLALLAGVAFAFFGSEGAAIFLVLAFFYTVLALGHLRSATSPATAVAAPPEIDGQTRLDLLHLFNFAVAQTTVHMLESLIRTAEGPEVTDAFKSGEDSDAAHEAKNWFVGFARGKLGHGTDRQLRFSLLMKEMEGEAERGLEAIPHDQRPSGDQLRLRRHAIANAQFVRAVLFLKREKRNVEEALVGQRHGLIERLTTREGG